MASSAFSGSGAKRKRPHKFLCGTPQSYCTGGQAQTSHGLKNMKTHGSSLQAFNCYKSYLIQTGYKQVGPRELCKDDGPIVVLTKKSRFGARLRGAKGDRQMPSTDATGGVVMST